MESTDTDSKMQLFLQRCEMAVDRQEILDRVLCSYLSAGRRDLASFLQNCTSSKSVRFGNIYRYQEKDIIGRLYSLLLRGLVIKIGDWWYSAPEDFVRATSYKVDETGEEVFEQEKESKELNSSDPLGRAFGIWSRLKYPRCRCPDEDTHDSMHYLLRYAWIKISDLISPAAINEEINKILITYDLPTSHREEIEALGIQRKIAISRKTARKTSKKTCNNAKKLTNNGKKSVDRST